MSVVFKNAGESLFFLILMCGICAGGGVFLLVENVSGKNFDVCTMKEFSSLMTFAFALLNCINTHALYLLSLAPLGFFVFHCMF